MPSNPNSETSAIETKCVNTIRTLAMDAVVKANSGHSGTPMALAPIAHVLYTRILRHNPQNPQWFNRDRFILSAGHASMLLYSILHLTGYDVSLDDIKSFRQWDSKTPGHPEVHHTQGVEVTTGPLGQGFANAVGMAMAEEYLRAKCGKDAVDHNIFVLCSDGDLMEGISYEAASLAGHNKLSKLIAIYDDNKITIDGSTDLSFSEDVATRFKAQGWNVISAGEISEDLDAIEATINQAKSNTDAPTIIIVNSHIGYPSPGYTDTSAAHGALTNVEDLNAAKQIMGMSIDPFTIDQDVKDFYHAKQNRFDDEVANWQSKTQNNDDLQAVISGTNNELSKLVSSDLANYFSSDKAPEPGDQIATRVTCSEVLNTIGESFPALIGGSADLTGNTGAKVSAFDVFNSTNKGRQVHFGIREHAMAACANGMATGYNLKPFVGTFFVFSDYMRPSIRLAAISKAPVLFVLSHDSVGVGEDGPTHQPIEHLASLRAMPGLNVVRPADAYETAAAIEFHFKNATGPTALILTRQNVPTLDVTRAKSRNGIHSGAYSLNEIVNPDIVLASTGSEVHLCVQASDALAEQDIKARVVSIPCVERMNELNESERKEIFGDNVPVLSVEAAATFGWSAIADESIGIDRFGASAPAGEVFTHLGITTQAIVDAASKLVSK